MTNRLSKLTNNSEQAMSIKYNTIVYELQKQGKSITVLSLGEAFFDIPLLPIDTLDKSKMYHYSHSKGIPELREKLAEYFLKEYKIPINYEKEILITTGSKAAIHFALMAILNPNDEVIIPEPAWVSYPEQVKLCYANPIQIPYDKDVYDFEKYITGKTKAIIINNPHNPSGYIYSKNEIEYLLSLAKKYNLWLLSDEAYSEFTNNNDFISPGTIDKNKEHTIIFNSISKNYGISGWRLGYVIANEKVIYNILKVNQHIITCAPTILQLYIDKYFYDILKITKPQIKILIDKRKEISDYISEIGLKRLKGAGTFYFFISILPSKLSSEEFCTNLLSEHYISVVPGIGYGNSCDNFIRVSVGTVSISKIKKALLIIKELIDKTTKHSTTNTNKVLVVAGGLWQIPLIKFLKNKGHDVDVIDPYLYSAGIKLANNHIKKDVRNVGEIYNEIKDNKYLFITTDQSDISVNTVSVLSEKLKLKTNKSNITNIFVNKFKMREYASKINNNIPAFAKIETINDLHMFIKKHKLPIIIKPVDSQSSRGVEKITKENINNIDKFYVESLKFSSSDYIIAEKFIEGTEVTVEGFASNFKHRTMAISTKKHFRTGIASSLEYPANISNIIFNEIETQNDKFVEHSGLEFGITHAEYIIENRTNKPYLVEIACRGGGTLISSDITNWVSGQNIYEMFYDNLIGKTTNVKKLELLKRNAVLRFFEFKEGKVKNIIGIEEAKTITNVFKIHLSFKIGDTLLNAKDDRSRQGFVIIFSNTKQELDNCLNKILNTIKIEYE